MAYLHKRCRISTVVVKPIAFSSYMDTERRAVPLLLVWSPNSSLLLNARQEWKSVCAMTYSVSISATLHLTISYTSDAGRRSLMRLMWITGPRSTVHVRGCGVRGLLRQVVLIASCRHSYAAICISPLTTPACSVADHTWPFLAISSRWNTIPVGKTGHDKAAIIFCQRYLCRKETIFKFIYLVDVADTQWQVRKSIVMVTVLHKCNEWISQTTKNVSSSWIKFCTM